jgi:L-threonylcarbamoyladenylate synthase
MHAVVVVDPTHPDPAVIAQAAERVQRGELVAFPTETVYGLGANALDAEAVARIYAAKGRPAWNPVITHVASVEAAQALARAWPRAAQQLAAAFWPGPVTLVVPRAPIVPDIVTAGGDAVAIRIPDHPVALALLRAAAVPVAAPSANRFTQVSPTTAAHVVQSLGDRVSLVLDGGPCAVGIESTVVDCTGEEVLILRPGMIGRESLEQALAGTGITVRYAPRRSRSHHAGDDAPAAAAPGEADRHYAPNAEVWLFDAAQREEVVRALARRDTTAGNGVWALLRTVQLPAAATHVTRMPTEPAGYARALYAALHDADAAGAALVLIEAPPADSAWEGVRDRLTRASH